MSGLLAAILGGAIGVVLTALARAVALPTDVRTSNADVAERDDQLATWVADRHYLLGQELRRIRTTMHARGQGTAGALDNAIAAAKAAALHEYRDEARLASADVARIRAREGTMHRLYRRRKWRPDPFPILATPVRAVPVLNTWRRAANENPGSRPTPVEDATARTLEETIANLRASSP